MVMLAPLLTALLPSVVSGIGSFFGRRSANKANRDESGLNRSFQERMSSTAYQRSVKDLEAAGMNPALAYQQGGASSPGGSMAASQESELGEGVSSALAVKTATEQYKLLRAQTAKTKQEGRNVQTEGQALERENIRGQTQFGYYFNGDGTPTAKMKELLQTEHGAKMANGARSVSEMNLSKLREPEMKAMAKLFEQIGAQGSGVQKFLPMIIQLMRGR